MVITPAFDILSDLRKGVFHFISISGAARISDVGAQISLNCLASTRLDKQVLKELIESVLVS